MCATARSSASPPQRVRARWPSPLFTDTWRKRHDPVHEQPCFRRGSIVRDSLMSADAQPDVLDVRFPTRRILAIIGDKWTTVVLYCLSIREHRRFNELQKQVPDISKKMLNRLCATSNATGFWNALSISRCRRKPNIGSR